MYSSRYYSTVASVKKEDFVNFSIFFLYQPHKMPAFAEPMQNPKKSLILYFPFAEAVVK